MRIWGKIGFVNGDLEEKLTFYLIKEIIAKFYANFLIFLFNFASAHCREFSNFSKTEELFIEHKFV